MRWRFIDHKNQLEAAQRGAVIETIHSWWHEFQAKTEDLSALFSRKTKWDLPEWMNLHLGAIHQSLMWEFGRAIYENGHRLVITPESHHSLRPLVRAILNSSPAIEGWEFYEYRPAEDLETALLTVQARAGHDIGDFNVRVSKGEGNRIDLSFSSPSIVSSDDQSAFNAAFVATESLLGEECLNDWIGIIETTRWPSKTESKSPEGSAARKPPNFIGLDRMKANVDALIDSIQEQLPAQPHYEWCEEDTQWTMWELKPVRSDDYFDQDDLFVGKSANSLQWISAHNGQRFCSKRFSRCEETFCYVKLDGSQGLSEEGFADKSEIEDALDEVLKPMKLGCHIGGGTGLRYSYIDLALTDVEKAIQVVRSRLQAGNVPKRSWIQFFDGDLAEEWIGIYDDTPQPPMSSAS